METKVIEHEVAEVKRYTGHETSTASMVLDGSSFDSMMRVAEVMATGKSSIPVHLRSNAGDCLAVIMQAMQWQMNPFAVAQKTHLVNGVLGYEAQLVNAVIQASGAIAGRFHYEYKGEGNALECRVGAVLRGETDITWGEWLKSSEVTTKNSPLWKTNPKQQLGYLQVKNWSRLYCPGAILGVYTPDELVDVQPQHAKDVTPKPAELPAYPDEKFDEHFPAWESVIRSGKKTAAQVIATVESKNTLTDTQKVKIRSCEYIEAETHEDA